MKNEQIETILVFNESEFSNFTGGADVGVDGDFREWIQKNSESLKWSWNRLTTLGDIWVDFIGLEVEPDPEPESEPQTIEEMKAYLKSREIEGMMGIGWEKIQEMQQGK